MGEVLRLSNVFSTNCKPVTCCPNPVMTIGFPRTGAPGPNTVVLANGAVVNLVELGRIISQFCPQFTCPTAEMDG